MAHYLQYSFGLATALSDSKEYARLAKTTDETEVRQLETKQWLPFLGLETATNANLLFVRPFWCVCGLNLQEQALPLRWAASEVVKDLRFSTKSEWVKLPSDKNVRIQNATNNRINKVDSATNQRWMCCCFFAQCVGIWSPDVGRYSHKTWCTQKF
jgi:hypothetical protein